MARPKNTTVPLTRESASLMSWKVALLRSSTTDARWRKAYTTKTAAIDAAASRIVSAVATPFVDWVGVVGVYA